MDLLNVAPENHDYDGLNENSSDVERLDVVFKILQKSSSPVWLDYDHLFIPNGKKNVFNAKLKNTNLVAVQETKMEPTFQLNPNGLLLLDKYLSYSNYVQQLQKQQETERTKLEERERLEMQKLRGEVDDLTNRLLDYDSTKSRTVRSEKIAIAAVILTVIGLVLQWLLNKSG